MNRPEKIAVYCGELPPPTFIDRLIIGLANNGFKLVLFGTLKRKFNYANPSIKVIGTAGKWSQIRQLILYTLLLQLKKPKQKRKLDDWIKQRKMAKYRARLKFYPVLYQQPDILHLQWVKSIGEWVWVKKFGIKLVVSLRGAHLNYTPICNPEFAEIYKQYFPLVSRFHAVSNAIKEEAIQYNLNPDRTNVIYSGLDLFKFEFQAKTLSTDCLQIISIGRSHWKKGYNYALDTMRILKEANIRFQYTIVGLNEEEELLFQRNELNLEQEVVFLNKLPFDTIKDMIREADLFLLPSVEEGIANVVLEAMALGTLVVSTDCGGMKEVINDGLNGFIVPVRSPQKMADAIQSVQKLDKEKYFDMIDKARLQVEEHHTEERMIKGFRELYRSIYHERK